MAVKGEPVTYTEQTEISFLGRRFQCLDLSREISRGRRCWPYRRRGAWRFPPGYVEPRHTHDSGHSVIVLEGLQIAEGDHMHPGDYVLGGANTAHGPFEYPEGCVVFASFRGASAQHRYPGSKAGE